jgi:hypothetical protein
METSIYLAQLIGPTLLVLGLGMLVNRESYHAMAGEFLRSRSLIFMSGLMALVPGIAIVLAHNVWAADWPVIITIFGWLAVIGGIIRVLFPKLVVSIGEKMLESHTIMSVGGALVLVLGAVLSYFGYLAA